MKALTVRQPWAWCIFHGKGIENRDWPTHVRGRVAIHAAKGMTAAAYNAALYSCYEDCALMIPNFDGLERGVVLGTVEIVDCITASSSPWFVGKYGFVLRNPMLYASPVPAKGALGFWEW